MSHKKAGGSTLNGRDSIAKRLGLKVSGGQMAKSGSIIIRQKGTKYHPGLNVGMGKDFTIYSLIEGVVYFNEKALKKYNGRIFKDTIVNVKPLVKASK